MFIQITMAYAQATELFYSANTLVLLEDNKASSNQAFSTNENCISLGSGMYLYRLNTQNFTGMKKIVLLK